MASFYDGEKSLGALSTDDFSSKDLADIDSRQSEHMSSLVREMLLAVGEDPTREGLIDTPKRVHRALEFLTEGYTKNLEEVVNGAIFESPNDDIVLVKDVETFSLCEHHMLPFWGKTHIAYIPDGRVVGLSKLPRIADVFSRRLQLQERLTTQIADAVEDLIQPLGVAVITDCRHMCMMMRGVQKNQSSTVCREFRGTFKSDDSLRRDLMSMLDMKSPL